MMQNNVPFSWTLGTMQLPMYINISTLSENGLSASNILVTKISFAYSVQYVTRRPFQHGPINTMPGNSLSYQY